MTLATLLMILLSLGGIPTCNKITKCRDSKIVVHKPLLVKRISK